MIVTRRRPFATDRFASYDDHGLGLEPGNLAAINSLKLYRTLRYGRNVELILTDNRSYRSEPVMHRAEATAFQPQQFPYVLSDNVVDVFDGGREFDHGKPPDEISFNGKSVSNPRKDALPQLDPRRYAKSVVPGKAECVAGAVETVGELGRDGRVAYRLPEPAGRRRREVARLGLRDGR